MPFKHTWTTHEKRGSWKYAKYDTVLKVIVAEPENSKKAPSAIYLSKATMEILGDPTHIEFMFDGDLVAFRATLPEDPNGYVVNRPVEKDNEGNEISKGRPFLSARSVISKYGLKIGAYDAQKEVSGAEVVVYFNSKAEPSKV